MKKQEQQEEDYFILKLYIVGQTKNSALALTNLKKICEEHLPGKYEIEVIDLMLHPELAQKDQILAIPTLVRKLPNPVRKIVGNLSKTDSVIAGLDIKLK